MINKPLKLGEAVINATLDHLAKYLDNSKYTEIRINRAKEIVLEKFNGELEVVKDDNLTISNLKNTVLNLASIYNSPISAENIKKNKYPLSCTLYKKHRFQALIGASVLNGVSISIRLKNERIFPLSAFGLTEEDQRICLDVMHKLGNIIISGSTNTGKTSILRTLMREIPSDLRMLALEDTPELEMYRFIDGGSFLVSRDPNNKNGMLNHSEMYDHFMRSSPTGMAISEISTSNVLSYLNSLTAGNRGVLTTIHASNVQQVYTTKLNEIVALTGEELKNSDSIIKHNVDLIIQLERDLNRKRICSQIYLPKEDKYIKNQLITLKIKE